MIIFNLTGFLIGLVVCVGLYFLAQIWPAAMAPPWGGWTTGAVCFVVGGLADLVGLKPRLFFLPIWLIGLVGLGCQIGVAGSVIVVGLLLAAMIAIYFKTRKQEAGLWAALQAAPPTQPPPVGADETPFWEWAKSSLFLPTWTDYSPAICAHDLRVLKLIRESGVPLSASEAATIRAQEDFLARAQGAATPPGFELKIQQPMERLVEKRLRAAQEKPPTPATAETHPSDAAAPGVEVQPMHVPLELVEAANIVGGDADLTSLVVERTSLTLAWIPGWYGQDQDLVTGSWQTCSLLTAGPVPLKAALETSGFQGIFSLYSRFNIKARVDRIVHCKLGELRSVVRGTGDPCSFDVTRLDGSIFLLDDEDGAGWCNIPGVEPTDWALCVTVTVDPKEVAESLGRYRSELTGKNARRRI